VCCTKLGDESSKFFHAVATERFRINTITSLDAEVGRVLTSHPEKAALLWDEFKQRLGSTIQSKMFLDLRDLVQTHDLDMLGHPFT
jgi:hypothetical protein